jgi:conjugal transfer ATP-binding protein TraC
MMSNLKERILSSLVERKKKSEPLSIAQANAGVSRVHLSEYLHYKDFSDGFMFSTVGEELKVGFGMQLMGSALKTGTGKAIEIENIIKSLPVGATVHVSEFAWDGFGPSLDLWEGRQNKYNKNSTIQKMNRYRKQMFERAAYDPLHKPSKMVLRSIDRFLFVNLPYGGSLGNEDRVKEFIDSCVEMRDMVISNAEQAKLSPDLMGQVSTMRLLRKLVNPHLKQDYLDLNTPFDSEDTVLGLGESIGGHIAQKDSSVEVMDDGAILFSDRGDNVLAATHLTIDHYPNTLYPSDFGGLTGNIFNRDERINGMYYMYTNIHICDPDQAKEQVEFSLGILSKQANEGSEWLKKTLPHIFERSRNSELFLREMGTGAVPVRMYTGLILFTEPSSARMETEKVLTSWSNKGYKFSRERHISFPMWCASLPYCYEPKWDKPREGLSRAKLGKSINAASLFPVTADWSGNVPKIKEDEHGDEYIYSNGIPFVTGRGCLSFIDIFESETNYNFCIVATSGAGKSFLANDIVRDILSRDGSCYIIDMGGSYSDICGVLGGTNLDFPPSKPFSVNHFWGIKSDTEYVELKDALEESLSAMAFIKQEPSNEEHAAMVNGLEEAYQIHKDKLGAKEIYEYFRDVDRHGNPILVKIAEYFRRYAIGNDSVWFNGPPQVDMSNPFTILELNELNSAPALRKVIFTTILMLITRRIYSSDRSVPKMLLIDEAWALLADDRAAPFIEAAFRTIRKFFGAAGFITQSCADISISKASQSAFSNSAWKFFLAQKGDSITKLRTDEMLGKENSETVGSILEGVRRKDNYSELVVEHDGLFAPMRFFVDRFSGFVYSSKATDNKLIDKKSKELGVSRSEAMEILAGLKDV